MRTLAAGLFLILIAAALAGAGLATLPAWQQAALLKQDGVVLFPQPLPVSDYRFTRENGAEVGPEDLQGRKLLLFFGYTFCPDICPTTLMDLGRTWKQLPPELRDEYQVVLVSIDPARDTPQALEPYVHYFNQGFMAFTGNSASLAQLAGELNAVYQKVERDDAAYLMDHSANLALLDEQGRYLGYIEPPHNAARMVPLLTALSARQ